MNNIVGFYQQPRHMEGPRATMVDVVPGAILFIVGVSFDRLQPTRISTVEVRSLPKLFNNDRWYAHHVGVRRDGKRNKVVTDMSLRDAGIIPNTYNLCRTFTNREDAEIYKARMDNHQLTHFEQRTFEQIMRKRMQQYGY